MIRIAVFCAFLLGSCNSDGKLEKDFFHKYRRVERVEKMRQYSLEDQYKIFRYGMDKVEAAEWTLADPIAEKGIAVMPFLTAKLNSADDLTVRDILIILWQMSYLKAYEVRQDTTLIHFLEDRVPRIKNPDLQYMSRSLLDNMKVAHHVSETPLKLRDD
jgi:hypothetical protein